MPGKRNEAFGRGTGGGNISRSWLNDVWADQDPTVSQHRTDVELGVRVRRTFLNEVRANAEMNRNRIAVGLAKPESPEFNGVVNGVNIDRTIRVPHGLSTLHAKLSSGQRSPIPDIQREEIAGQIRLLIAPIDEDMFKLNREAKDRARARYRRADSRRSLR